MTGVTFIPGVTDLSYDLVGLGPTLWRVSWVCTTAALVGVVGAGLSQRFAVAGGRLWRYAIPGAMVAVFMLFGSPIWTSGANVDLKAPWDWQRSSATMETARAVVADSRAPEISCSRRRGSPSPWT